MTYNNNLEHLLDELHRIDLIIRLNLEKWRAEHQGDADDFLGLYISEDEVNAILRASPYGSTVDHRSNVEIEAVTREINRKKAESIKEGIELRLPLLSQLFHLSPFDADVLLICLAPELDLRYEKLYSYLQNDVTRKRPTVDLVINLLCQSMEERFEARENFSPITPLIKNRLLHLTGGDQEDRLPLLSRFIKVDERIVSFLLGTEEADPRIRGFSTIIQPKESLKDIILPGDTRGTLTELVKGRASTKKPMMFFFHGPYGTGKKMAAEAVCKELGTPLLVADSRAVLVERYEPLDILLREAVLLDTSLYLEGFDALSKEEGAGDVTASLIQKLDRFPNWVFLSGELPWAPEGRLENHDFASFAFPLPSYALRKRLWKSFMNGSMIGDADISALASKFNFSGGQIRDAVFTARNIAMAKNPGESKLSLEDIYLGCKAQSNKRLTALAKKVEPHYTWGDIVLPKDTKEQLREVCGYIKHKGTVYTDWGFDRKFSLGKGLNVLFSGPSGTGKTMAAEIIAGEAKLDLYKIDLSCVVSKYIGETEKNLRKIFAEAETSNAILFFDEADALFGKRTEVRDSHDRYANIEVNYLLQKMEEHGGIVILASNFRKNIDEAFLRRMHFTVELPFPDRESREEIWRNIYPGETPIGDEMDFSFLAEFKITGGNIKNIALCAAFLAAGDSGVVKMEHVIRAAKREFQKMGKLCTPGDFGEYFALVR